MPTTKLHPDRLFPAGEPQRSIARRLFAEVRGLPIISPHGHANPAWFAVDAPFSNPADLLITPDHYVYRMLYSQGVQLERLGLSPREEEPSNAPAPEAVWRLFAEHYHLFRGTPTRLWCDHVFAEVFDIHEPLSAATADAFYETINARLREPAYRPRALFERFNIEVLATTESPLDDLRQHAAIRNATWQGRVITTFRPDQVIDPECEGFHDAVRSLGELTGEDTATWGGYLRALRARRAWFKAHGATATDHGHPSARTADLTPDDAARLYRTVCSEQCSAEQAELFRAQMLTEMAAMSLDDGLVMQIHPGSFRNHNRRLYARFGPDRGADIPVPTDYVHALKPLLDRYGNAAGLSIILFTLDESAYSRELAPLAGHYPCLKLGPAWWFHDSPEGIRRFRARTMETAGFYNTVGFNDDTRAFLSLPARHDVARRVDCGFLAGLVAEHRLTEDEALDLAGLLAYALAKAAYRL